MAIWQETKGIDPGRRVSEPPAHGASVDRKLGPQDLTMPSQRSPVRPSLGDEDPRAHREGVPSECATGKIGRQSPTLIHLPEEHPDLDDLRLQFDHQQHPSDRMPGQDIDDPAFAVHRKRDLRFDHPAVQRREHVGHGFMHSRMTRIEEPRKVGSVPPHHRIEPRAESARYPAQGPERKRCRFASLEPAHHRCRDARSGGEVRLPPPFSDPDRPQCRPDTLVIHRLEDADGGLPAAYREGSS